MREILLSFIGSLSAGILFNVNRKKLLWIGFSGAIGWFVYSLAYKNNGSLIFSTFIGAVAVGFYSEAAARALKSPATIFSISGIFPLVPGITAYTAVQYMVENKLAEAANKAIETVASAGAIAFGIMMVYALFRMAHRIKHSRKYTVSKGK